MLRFHLQFCNQDSYGNNATFVLRKKKTEREKEFSVGAAPSNKHQVTSHFSLKYNR